MVPWLEAMLASEKSFHTKLSLRYENIFKLVIFPFEKQNLLVALAPRVGIHGQWRTKALSSAVN